MQTGWCPINAAHSIAAVHWRIHLAQGLEQWHRAKIASGDERIRSLLPKVETPRRVVEFGPDGVVTHQPDDDSVRNAPAMMKYARCAPNGAQAVALEVQGATITVTNADYSKWSSAAQVARQLLSDVGAALRGAPDIDVESLTIEYQDAFVWQGEWRPDALRNLLREQKDGWMVPPWAFKAGPVWHSEQGRLDDAPQWDGEEMVLCMKMRGTIGEFVGKPCPLLEVASVVRQRNKYRGKPLPLRLQDAFSNVADIAKGRNGGQDRFDDMHSQANQMLRVLLTPSMRERIGLAA